MCEGVKTKYHTETIQTFKKLKCFSTGRHKQQTNKPTNQQTNKPTSRKWKPNNHINIARPS